MLPVVAERLFRARRLRRRLPGRARRPVLRPAVREQGPDRRRRPQVGRARGRAARRQRGRPLADRVRHQPVRLPDEEVPGRPAGDPGQHRVRPRHACCRAWRSHGRREPIAVHPVCSVRKMGSVDKLMAIAGRCSAHGRDRRRGAVLRLRRRARLHPARAQRARAAPPEGSRSRRTARAGIRPAAPARSACRNRPAFRTGRSCTWSSAASTAAMPTTPVAPPSQTALRRRDGPGVPAGAEVDLIASATSSAMSRD